MSKKILLAITLLTFGFAILFMVVFLLGFLLVYLREMQIII